MQQQVRTSISEPQFVDLALHPAGLPLYPCIFCALKLSRELQTPCIMKLVPERVAWFLCSCFKSAILAHQCILGNVYHLLLQRQQAAVFQQTDLAVRGTQALRLALI